MAQKRKTNQTKLENIASILKKIEEKTAQDVKGRLDGTWRENLFEIMMTRLELASPHKKAFQGLPQAFRHDPQSLPRFAKAYLRRIKRILAMAGAPHRPHHILAFGTLYLTIIDAFLKDNSKDLAKTMATLDKRLGMFEQLADMTPCKS